MPDRLVGLCRYMWKDRDGSSAVCKSDSSCTWGIPRAAPAIAGSKARAHTRETGHDTRVYHRQIVEYSAEATRA